MNKEYGFSIIAGSNAKDFNDNVLGELASDKALKVRDLDLSVNKFSNGELNVRLLESVRGSDTVILQLFEQPDLGQMHSQVFETLLLEDTVARSFSKGITLCLPFIPYLRQDRKAEGREPISAKVLLDAFYNASGHKLERIITFDMHNSAEQGFINVPIDNLPASPLFVNYFKSKTWFDANVVVLAPDVGSAKRAEKFASSLGLHGNVAIVNKARRKGKEAEAKSIVGDVKSRHVIMIDDMIDSGGTILAAAALAKRNGAKTVSVAATHGIFSNDAEHKFMESGIDVIVTDSIPRPDKYLSDNPWLTVVSLGKYTARAISENFKGNSISKALSEMFE